MRIIHVSAECFPVAKVGGLADVVGALPKYLNKHGEQAAVIMPAYNTKFTRERTFEVHNSSYVRIGNDNLPYKIYHADAEELGYELYLVHLPGLFDREDIYGYRDDYYRFIAFQTVVMEWVLQLPVKPDLVHVHDHHTGLIPFFMKHTYRYNSLAHIPTILTIHNANYQGQFMWSAKNNLPEYDYWKSGLLEWQGAINPLASAIKCSWAFTTVSHSYLEELFVSAGGLESLINAERRKSYGILNGIDVDVWDPATDTMIEHNYKLENEESGKWNNKKWLCETFKLDPYKPLVTFIGRFAREKGADILPEIIGRALYEFRGQFTFLVLGSGESSVEMSMQQLSQMYPGYMNCYIGYNEALAHKCYAGADFLLMPSRVEPCGLNQMYAMRYGTIPIVRAVGGLKDTVVDIGDTNGYGIRFQQPVAWDAINALYRSIVLYYQDALVKKTRTRIMEIDNSWDKSTKQYIYLYNNI